MFLELFHRVVARFRRVFVVGAAWGWDRVFSGAVRRCLRRIHIDGRQDRSAHIIDTWLSQNLYQHEIHEDGAFQHEPSPWQNKLFDRKSSITAMPSISIRNYSAAIRLHMVTELQIKPFFSYQLA